MANKASTASDRQNIMAVLTLAFSVDAGVRWVYPDPQQYLECFAEFTSAFAGAAFDCGSAYFAEGYTGAALWLPPGVHPDEQRLEVLFDRTLPSRKAELQKVFDEMAGYHPSEPHWYLPLIGVDPTYQGKGVGSALLQHALGECDRDGKQAYLESTSPQGTALYERHGFEVLGTIEADGAPMVLWPMLREPR